jgi:hypothetical protein
MDTVQDFNKAWLLGSTARPNFWYVRKQIQKFGNGKSGTKRNDIFSTQIQAFHEN